MLLNFTPVVYIKFISFACKKSNESIRIHQNKKITIFARQDYLPEDEVLFDYFFNPGVAPDIAIENLTCKFLDILNVHYKPLVANNSSLLGLYLKNKKDK